jgi:2-keto-myo-inositol isomerase
LLADCFAEAFSLTGSDDPHPVTDESARQISRPDQAERRSGNDAIDLPERRSAWSGLRSCELRRWSATDIVPLRRRTLLRSVELNIAHCRFSRDKTMSGFRYSLNSSTIKPQPILRKIAIAAEAGYEAIELWHMDIDAHLETGGSLADIRKAVDDAGLAVPTTIHIHGWFQPAGEEHQQAMDEARRKLEQAAAVGAPYAVAGPPHGVCDRELGAKHYRELLKLGEEFGVTPAMEYLGFVEEFTAIEDAMEIMERSGHPDACIVVDPFHCYVGGGPIESIGKLKAEQIAVSHFNDAPADPPPSTQRDPDRVMPGDGAIDLKLYCDNLREIGYDGFLSLELFREDLWQQGPLEVAKIGLEKMRAAAEA